MNIIDCPNLQRDAGLDNYSNGHIRSHICSLRLSCLRRLTLSTGQTD